MRTGNTALLQTSFEAQLNANPSHAMQHASPSDEQRSKNTSRSDLVRYGYAVASLLKNTLSSRLTLWSFPQSVIPYPEQSSNNRKSSATLNSDIHLSLRPSRQAFHQYAHPGHGRADIRSSWGIACREQPKRQFVEDYGGHLLLSWAEQCLERPIELVEESFRPSFDPPVAIHQDSHGCSGERVVLRVPSKIKKCRLFWGNDSVVNREPNAIKNMIGM